MEITFIGTGSGITQLNRFHTSIFFETKTHKLLVDTGDGVSKALLNSKINITEINSIFITHTHADHFSGIASLLTQMKMNRRTKPLNFYIHNSFKKFAIDFLQASFLFPKTFDFEFNVIGYNNDMEIELTPDFNILPKQNNHIINKHNITNLPDLQFVSSSVLIMGNSIPVHYSSDIGNITDLSLFNKFSPKFLIVESTHILFQELIEFIRKSNYSKIFLVHINDSDKIIEQYGNLSEELKSKIALTSDGMRVTLS